MKLLREWVGTLVGGRKKIIHVNQHNIKKNRKHGTNLPVLTCKDYKTGYLGHEAVIYHGNIEIGRLVYRPDKPLSCGAHVWFETHDCTVRVTRQKELKSE